MTDEAVPFDDRGLAYGDGLFETVLVRDGRPLLWRRHLARLQEGCSRLGIPFPDPARLETLPAQSGPGLHVLKIVLTRGSGGRGYLPPAESEPRLRWRLIPFTPWVDRWREGVKVRLCDLKLSIQPRLAGIKHLNRLENVLARQEWSDPDTAEGLLSDHEGRLVEATGMNLFWLRDGQLETPCLDRCGVAGTLRAALLDTLAMTEVSCRTEILTEIQSLWIGNSVQGVWPVTSVEDISGQRLCSWPIHPSSRSLQNTAHALLGYPSLN